MYFILKCQQFEEKKAKRMGECKGRKERVQWKERESIEKGKEVYNGKKGRV